EVSACPLHARSGGKPGELTVTPGETDTAPELGRACWQGAGRQLSLNFLAIYRLAERSQDTLLTLTAIPAVRGDELHRASHGQDLTWIDTGSTCLTRWPQQATE